MRLLVTGATGFLGQRLVRHVIEEGFDTSILVREIYGLGQPLPAALQNIRADLQLVYADLRNLALTRRAVAEAHADIVIHLAAAGVTDPFLPVEQAIRHNVTGTINLARAAFESSPAAQRMIVARTPGEADPSNAYQASKAAAWRFCRMYVNQLAWPINGATIFQAYGPCQPANSFVPAAFSAAQAGADFAMSSGAQQRDWIFVEDVVSGLVAAARSELQPGVTVELGTGVTHSLREVAEAIFAVTGRGGRPRPGSLADRPGEADLHAADADAAERLTGWRAAVPLRTGLEKVWRAMNNS